MATTKSTATSAFMFPTRQHCRPIPAISCRSFALSTLPIRYSSRIRGITAWRFLLTRLIQGLALVTALLFGHISITLAQIPAGDDIGYQNAAVSGRCVASDLVHGGTSIRILNGGSGVMNGIAIIALNLSRNACVSLNTPPGSVQLAIQAYGSGCAAIYYMVWQPHNREPWLYLVRPAGAPRPMCTADTLSTISPTDAAPTANVGSGTETTGGSPRK